MAISAAVFLATYRHQEDERIRHIFAEQAAPVSALVRRALDRYLETVRSIGALYAASNAVDRDEFRAFVEHGLARMPGIQAMEWIPRVPAAARADYEASARRDGFTDFRIMERNAAGEMVPAASRAEYFPVFFVEPLLGNERAVGFDLASNPARRAALDEARDSGEMVGTQRITLVQEEGSQFGFLVFMPVYQEGVTPATVEERRARLMGFSLGVFRIGDILEAAMDAAGRLTELDLYIFDRSAEPGKRLLHHHRAAHNPIDAPNLAEEKVLSGLYQASSVSVAGRDWQLVFKPVAPHGFEHIGALPLSSAAAVLLLTLLLVQYLRTALGRAIKVERMVNERTEQLRASKQALEDEMGERQNAERALGDHNKSLQLLQKITLAANSAPSVEEAVRLCVDEVCAYTGWPVGHAFFLSAEGTGQLQSTDIWHLADRDRFEPFARGTLSHRFDDESSLPGRVLAAAKPCWITDIAEEADCGRASLARHSGLHGAFAFPVMAGSTVVAVLEFYDTKAAAPNQQILGIMAQLGTQLGRAVERAHSEQAHRERERFMRLVTDNLPALIVYVDESGRLQFINRTGETWFDRPREALIGTKLHDLFDAEVYEFLRPYFEGALAGEAQTFDMARVFPDGIRRDVAVTYVPHHGAEGQVHGFFGIILDNTERREMTRQLGQSQKMEAIGQLTGGIAHDFNNLLMVIDGYARRAKAKLSDTEAANTALDEVLKGTDRAAKLTRQLLSFSRRQILDRRVFRIEEVFSDVQELLQRSTGERHKLRFKRLDGGACVETDPSELAQALVNLAINARDAMPRGGNIDIGSDVVDLDQGLAVAGDDLAPGRYVAISVQDHGEGIDEETLAHIFEPFFTTKEQGKGTGLGLAMVYGFAKQSGGAIQVESAVGQGTTFRIYLPLVERETRSAAVAAEPEQRGNGETILLVEDDEALLALSCDVLQGLGYKVLAARDGLEALELECGHDAAIDLMLSDVVMPTLGGFEVAEMLRATRPDMKVVFMSGYPDRGPGRGDASFENMPANARFLQKPVKPDRLAKVIRAELDHVDRRLSA